MFERESCFLSFKKWNKKGLEISWNEIMYYVWRERELYESWTFFFFLCVDLSLCVYMSVSEWTMGKGFGFWANPSSSLAHPFMISCTLCFNGTSDSLLIYIIASRRKPRDSSPCNIMNDSPSSLSTSEPTTEPPVLSFPSFGQIIIIIMHLTHHTPLLLLPFFPKLWQIPLHLKHQKTHSIPTTIYAHSLG